MLGNYVAFLLVVNFLHFSTHPKDFYGINDPKFTRFWKEKKQKKFKLPDFYEMFEQVAKI
jgi:hypothetical protein